MRWSRSRTLVSMLVAVIAVPLAMFFIPSFSPCIVVVVDSSILRIGGRNLTGFIYIAIPTPRNLYAYSYPLTHERVFVIDTRSAARDWIEFYAKNLGRLRGKGVPLPAVSIALFLYDGNGTEYLVTYSYSTVIHYLRQRHNILEAVREALRDPLAMFRQTILIELRPGLMGLTIARLELGKAVAGIRQKIEESTSSLGSKLSPTSIRVPSSNASGACPAIATVTYWDTLYSSRNSPPPGWFERVKGYLITDEIRRGMWRYYAYHYSQAYLFRSDVYTLDAALSYVYEKLGGPGLYTMDWFLKMLASRVGYGFLDVWWDDVYPQGYAINIDVPIIGIEMHYNVEEPIEVLISIDTLWYSFYRTGIALAGTIVVGWDNAVEKLVGKPIRAYLSTPRLEFIMVPTAYRYIGDGFLLVYDHRIVTYSGCRYWEIIPIGIPFVPYYMKQQMDLNSAYIYEGEPPTYSDFAWSGTTHRIYSSRVTNYVPNTIAFFSDNTFNSPGASFAGIATSIIRTLIDNLTNTVLRHHPIRDMVLVAISMLLSYAEINTKLTLVVMVLDLFRIDTLTQPVTVYVDRYTTKSSTILLEDYAPLMTKYIVTVNASRP